MALRSALSLGINLRLTDNRTEDAAKEARGRLWWSIYSMEHILTLMTGRASCVGESLCSVPPPLPCEEETFDHPEAKRLFQDPKLRESQLRPTLFEVPSQFTSQSYISTCAPCPSLFSTFQIDLNLITHALVNKVYSIEGLRKGPSQIEYHIQKFDQKIDRWKNKLPPVYQFTLPDASPWHLNHSQLDDLSAPFVRERVCLAMNYYSARITLCRPCLTHTNTQTHSSDSSPRSKLRADMATHCLQAACAMISILPEDPDMCWLARAAPWWSVLHYLMQATTALLLGLSFSSYLQSASPNPEKQGSPLLMPGTPSFPSLYPPLLDADLSTAILSVKSALRWLHMAAEVDIAARRASVHCERIVRKIAPGLGFDLDDLPDGRSFIESVRLRGEAGNRNVNRYGNGNGNGNATSGHESNGSVGVSGSGNGYDSCSGIEAFEELVDFEGGMF
jgi:hypothetical protein